MTRRRKILVCVLCGVIAVGAVCFFCLRDAEPSYNGRTLSEWLGDAQGGESVTEQRAQEDAIQAVSKIGTNATPILLTWNQQRTSRGLNKLRRIARYIPSESLHQSAVDFLWRMTAQRKHMLAHIGFQILGTNSTAVVPQVTAQFNSARDWESLCNDANALSMMGEQGASVLQQNFESPDPLKRNAAILNAANLWYLGTKAEGAVVALAKIVSTHTNAQSRRFAITSLVLLADVSRSAGPAIQVALNDPDRTNREEATNSLEAIQFVSKMNSARPK